jgi:methionyl-tRNA formyltransferase
MHSARIIFAGAGAFGIPALTALLDAHYDVTAVYTQPDRPAGRGRKLTPTPIADFARTRALNVITTPDINTEKLPTTDVMVVIAFGQKIAPHIVNHARLGSVNLHASRLPKYRGAAPINRAIIQGDTITGNSIIRLADKMDAGAVLAMSEIMIGETDTAGDLHDRLARDGGPLVLRVVNQLLHGTIDEVEQDHTHATAAPKLSRETAVIDWTQPCSVVSRFINGLSPWPGCSVHVADKNDTLRLLRARPIIKSCTNTCPPGTMDDAHHIICGSGAIELIDVQPAGKKPMTFTDYQRGHALKPGTRLASHL